MMLPRWIEKISREDYLNGPKDKDQDKFFGEVSAKYPKFSNSIRDHSL